MSESEGPKIKDIVTVKELDIEKTLNPYEAGVSYWELKRFNDLLAEGKKDELSEEYATYRDAKLKKIQDLAEKGSINEYVKKINELQVDALGHVLGVYTEVRGDVNPALGVIALVLGHANEIIDYTDPKNYVGFSQDEVIRARQTQEGLYKFYQQRNFPEIFYASHNLLGELFKGNRTLAQKTFNDYVESVTQNEGNVHDASLALAQIFDSVLQPDSLNSPDPIVQQLVDISIIYKTQKDLEGPINRYRYVYNENRIAAIQNTKRYFTGKIEAEPEKIVSKASIAEWFHKMQRLTQLKREYDAMPKSAGQMAVAVDTQAERYGWDSLRVANEIQGKQSDITLAEHNIRQRTTELVGAEKGIGKLVRDQMNKFEPKVPLPESIILREGLNDLKTILSATLTDPSMPDGVKLELTKVLKNDSLVKNGKQLRENPLTNWVFKLLESPELVWSLRQRSKDEDLDDIKLMMQGAVYATIATVAHKDASEYLIGTSRGKIRTRPEIQTDSVHQALVQIVSNKNYTSQTPVHTEGTILPLGIKSKFQEALAKIKTNQYKPPVDIESVRVDLLTSLDPNRIRDESFEKYGDDWLERGIDTRFIPGILADLKNDAKFRDTVIGIIGGMTIGAALAFGAELWITKQGGIDKAYDVIGNKLKSLKDPPHSSATTNETEVIQQEARRKVLEGSTATSTEETSTPNPTDGEKSPPVQEDSTDTPVPTYLGKRGTNHTKESKSSPQSDDIFSPIDGYYSPSFSKPDAKPIADGSEGRLLSEKNERSNLVIAGEVVHIPKDQEEGFYKLLIQRVELYTQDPRFVNRATELNKVVPTEKVAKIDVKNITYEEDQLVYRIQPSEVIYPFEGYKIVKIIQQDGGTAFQSEIGSIEYQQNETPTDMVIVAEKVDEKELPGSRMRVIEHNPELKYNILLHPYTAREVASKLGNDPALQKIVTDYSTEMEELSAHGFPDKETNFTILRNNAKFERYLNARGYADTFVVDRSTTSTDFFVLEALAQKPHESIYCQIATDAVINFNQLVGVTVEAALGGEYKIIKGKLVQESAHVASIIILPDGTKVWADMQPALSQSQLQELDTRTEQKLDGINFTGVSNKEKITQKIEAAQKDAQDNDLLPIGVLMAGLAVRALYPKVKNRLVRQKAIQLLQPENEAKKQNKDTQHSNRDILTGKTDTSSIGSKIRSRIFSTSAHSEGTKIEAVEEEAESTKLNPIEQALLGMMLVDITTNPDYTRDGAYMQKRIESYATFLADCNENTLGAVQWIANRESLQPSPFAVDWNSEYRTFLEEYAVKSEQMVDFPPEKYLPMRTIAELLTIRAQIEMLGINMNILTDSGDQVQAMELNRDRRVRILEKVIEKHSDIKGVNKKYFTVLKGLITSL
jgi:hypothetical protein